jgi:glycosyltransferase involved in cell wall biosynthesis
MELTEAASHLYKEIPGLKLRMIGKGEISLINKLVETAKKLQAHDLLEFPGFFPKEALPEELSRAHVFAAPSWYEGGPGFVYLEAMACGLPVIGCSGSGLEENIIDGVNGFLVSPKNTNELENALRKLLSNKSKIEEMGRNARLYAVEKCDHKIWMERLENYYKKVIGNQADNLVNKD